MEKKLKWLDSVDVTNFRKYPKTAIFGIILYIVSLILLWSVSWKIPVGVILFLWSMQIDKLVKKLGKKDKLKSDVHIPKEKLHE